MEPVCCPQFDPGPWDEKMHTWENKLFVKDHVTSLFHIPLNFGRVMARSMARIEAAGAKSPTQIVLSDECSLWRADVYIEVTRTVAGAEMSTISGHFLSKVFEGAYSNMGKWMAQMKAYAEGQGKQIVKLYFYYTTCPRCAKKYGRNYVVLLAQV